MPVPVLQIPIDDADFKKFVETFKNYQEELKNQPEAWQGINSSLKSVVDSAESFVGSLDDQLRLTEKLVQAESSRDTKYQESSRRKKKDRDEEDRHEERMANRRRVVLDQVREYSRNVGDIAKRTGGFLGGMAESAMGGITGGAGGLFGAAGGILRGIPLVGGLLGGLAVAGYETMSVLNNTQRQAHSMGVDTSTLQAWQTSKLAHQLPQGAVENLLGTVSEAQASPSGGGLFSRFGVKGYNTKNVSEISAEMLINAQKYLQQHPGNAGLWGAKSLYGGALDTGTLRILQQMSPEELKSSLDEMKQFAKDNRDAEKAATKATQTLAEAEQAATEALDQYGGKLVDAISQVVNALKDLHGVIQPFLNAGKMWHDVTTDPWGSIFGHVRKSAPADDKRVSDNIQRFLDDTGLQKGYDTVVAHIKSAIPITSMSISDLLGFGKSTLIPTTRAMGIGRDRRGLIGSSATGLYQITGETINSHADFLQKRFGQNWREHKYDSEFQDALAEQIFNENKYGDLASVWASLPNHRRGAYSRYSFDQIKHILAKGESGGVPVSDTRHSAEKMEKALKEATRMAQIAQRTMGMGVKIKTESKPGSDVNVTARQMAGR